MLIGVAASTGQPRPPRHSRRPERDDRSERSRVAGRGAWGMRLFGLASPTAFVAARYAVDSAAAFGRYASTCTGEASAEPSRLPGIIPISLVRSRLRRLRGIS
jgi:hypothetical protein